MPELYADGWGDYYGVFVWHNRDLRPSQGERRTLAVQMLLAIVPTLLLVGGWLALLWQAFGRGRLREAPERLLVGLLPLAGIAGMLYFTVSYPTSDGDVIKATYMLTTVPAWALCFGYGLDGDSPSPAAPVAGARRPARARRALGPPHRPVRLTPRDPLIPPPLPSPSVTAVLFTCAGQRVDIVTAFGRAGATTIACDLDRLAPALYHADHMALVPRVDDPGYVPALAALVAEHDVRLVVPLTDLDQGILSRNRSALAPALVLAPPPEVCATMGDKYLAHAFFEEHGIPSPRSWLPADVPDDARYPLLVKVREGFGSRHIYRAADAGRARVLPRAHDRRIDGAGALPRRGVLDRRVLRPRGAVPQRDRADDDPVEGRRVDQGHVDPRSRS